MPLVRQSLEAIAAGDARFFHAHLPTRETWRLYAEFAERVGFLDIETTGLSADYDQVTTIGVLGGGKPALFIQGVNLDQFPAFVAQFPLLVTFNGSQFDLPFLRAHFPQVRLDHAHIDLRFCFFTRWVIEADSRRSSTIWGSAAQAIQGVDGFEAVRLWHRWRRGERAALMKLALYNLTDVVNLVDLVDIAVVRKLRQTPFPGGLPVVEPVRSQILDSEYVSNWITGQLQSWGLA